MLLINEQAPVVNNYFVYFVWRGPKPYDPFRVVYRRVKARTSKGSPITYEMRSVPEAYETWEEAKLVADQLNETGMEIRTEMVAWEE